MDESDADYTVQIQGSLIWDGRREPTFADALRQVYGDDAWLPAVLPIERQTDEELLRPPSVVRHEFAL